MNYKVLKGGQLLHISKKNLRTRGANLLWFQKVFTLTELTMCSRVVTAMEFDGEVGKTHI